ncbi:MAG: insulinase family protein [Thermodesulfobacteriota bacterium]
MTRRLFGYILVAAALVAGYLYDDHLSRAPVQQKQAAVNAGAPAASAPPEAAHAKGGESPAPPEGPKPAAPAPDQAEQAKAPGAPVPAEALHPAEPVPSMPGQAREPAAPVPGAEVPVVDGKLLAKLRNGLTVLVVEDKRFPLVAERLYVRAGSAYEAKGQEGISHLLEHMVFNTTAKRPKGGVAADIEGAGGDANAATSFDYTQYMADLPSARWKLGLDVFQDMIFGAKFDAAELEQEKKVVVSELERGQDDPGQRLFQMSQRQVWRGLPYEHPIIGTRESVNSVTPGDLRAYVNRLYQPQSMLLVVVGDVDAREVFREAEAVFGHLANDRTVLPPDTGELPARTGGPSAEAAGGDWNKAYLRLNFTIPGMHSAKDIPLTVLSDLLGGGKTSRLYRKFVYEQQLADDVDVSAITLERGGMLSVEATLAPEKLEDFWAALVRELAELDAGSFTGEELDRAKLNIEDSLYRAKETLRGLASKLAYYQFFGFGPEGESNSVYEARSVDSAQLKGLVKDYIDPANASLAVLLPGQDKAGADARADAMLAAMKSAWPSDGKEPGKAEAGGKALETEVVDLGGGRVLVLMPDPTMPYASVSLTYRGGDALLPPDQQGLGELAAKALTRSTARRGAVEVQDFLADRASSLSASTGRDTFTVSARYPARFAADVTALMAEVVLEPSFDPAEVDRARKMQLAQIAETGDRPTSLAFRHLFPFLYPEGHYGYFRAGQPAEVEAFTPEMARAFWDRQRSMPWVMAVCGVFDRGEMLKLASRLAVSPEGQAPAFPDPAWSSKKEMTLTLPGRNQTHLFWIFPVEGKKSPDTPALEVLRAALAGQGGLLFQDLRDKHGLGYSVTAFLWQSPNTGFLAFYIGTTPDKEAQAMDGFRRVAAGLAAGGLDAASMERAKNSIEGEYHQERQSLGSRSQEASQDMAMGYPLNFERDLVKRVRGLTPEQLAQAARKYLEPAKTYLLKIEP